MIENPFERDKRFDDLIPIIKHTIELISEDKEEVKSVDVERINVLGRNKREQKVYSYLCSLESHYLEKIITIMYTGRDTTYIDEYGMYTYERSKIMTKHLFDKPKNDIASIIASKGALEKYLIDGCEKLAIKI